MHDHSGQEDDGRSHAEHNHAEHDHAKGGHGHAPASFGRAFAIGTALNLAFVLIEAVFGLRAHSMALLADAGHNLSDVFGLLLAWGGATLAQRRPTARRTYGLRSSTILAALANAVFLLIAIGAVAAEAVRRFRHPEPVDAGIVIWVASAGIIINSITALLFMSGRRGDLNIRGAFLHMSADAAVSAGVVVAGVLIAATGALWLDPVISLAIVMVVAVGTWGLLRDSANLTLNAVPAHIDPGAVDRHLRALPGVEAVHDLHIWGMSTTDVALTVHLLRPALEDEDVLLIRLCASLKSDFGIAHATIQIERGHGPHACELEPDHVV